MKKKLVLICVLFTQFSFAQYKFSVGFDNVYVNGIGTTKLQLGHSPLKGLELFVAPAYGLFSGGVSLFSDVKYTFFSENFVNPSIGVGFRHSFKNVVDFEVEPEVIEIYSLPYRDFMNFQTGINFNFVDPEDSEINLIISANALYSYVLVKKDAEHHPEQFSDKGIKAANRRLRSGFGFSISVIVTFNIRR